MSDIKLCTYCDGKGEHVVNVGYRSNDWETRRCTLCNGSGRVIECTYTLILPLNHDVIDKYHEVDSEIFEKIRNLTTYEKENRLSDFVEDLTDGNA